MAENSKIEWTDHTFNPWIGCTKVSPGCLHCYAETQDARRFSKTLPGTSKEHPVSHWGTGAPRYRTSEGNWNDPLKWNHAVFLQTDTIRHTNAFGSHEDVLLPEPKRPRVFCASLADWMDDEVPIEWLADLLKLIAKTPRLDWLLLTKRPENWKPRLKAVHEWIFRTSPASESSVFSVWIWDWMRGLAPSNIWIGTSVENASVTDRIEALRSIPAQVRFLSCEPLLGDLGPLNLQGIHWVICGGESGPKARPMHPSWARHLRDQCQRSGVPFHFKQWGEWLGGEFDARKGKMICQQTLQGEKVGDIFWTNPGAPAVHVFGPKDHYWEHASAKVGKKAAGRLLDGVEWDEFPQ